MHVRTGIPDQYRTKNKHDIDKRLSNEYCRFALCLLNSKQ